MTTELVGRDLDAAVAKAMGLRHWQSVDPKLPGYAYAYSAPDCSGLAPVLAWLRENGPTVADVERQLQVIISSARRPWVSLFQCDSGDWYAEFWYLDKAGSCSIFVATDGPDLPTAAAKLLVAWAERRATT